MPLEFNTPETNNHDSTLFVELILPLAVDGAFTYRVPRLLENDIALGKRVTVQFGKRHIYTGLVTEVHNRAPKNFGVKYILEILDQTSLISEKQFAFWRWVSTYYMCTLGEVMEAALPSFLKLKSETHIVLHPDYKSYTSDLAQNEKLTVQALEHENEMSLSDLQELLHLSNIMPVIRSLHGKGIILTVEDIKSNYKPKVEKRIRLNEDYKTDETLSAIFEVLEAKKTTQKQSDLLTAFLMAKKDEESVSKRNLLKQQDASTSSLKSLLNKGILEEFEIELDRWKIKEADRKDFELNTYQKKSLEEIKEGIGLNKVVLFHGITGSGKTHIYVSLLHEHLKESTAQGLYLVPEIALTTQLLSRMASFFGESIAVYHSRLNNSERYELWQGIRAGKYKLVVGARSAVFLPFKNLKFVIVDEEHEASFKQQDPAPRYNGRDAAIVLAKQYGIPIILGSATPSIESYFNAQNKKYHYVYLGKRFGDVLVPRIELIDLKEERKTKSVENNISRLLKMKMEKHLGNKDQVILFQNRRGYAPVLECDTCGWVPYCKNCDIILTYHKFNQTLSCHYCGYATGLPQKCGNCGQHTLKMKGTGTERIEDDLEILFPKNVVQRMDLDTTRKKNSLEDIISAVENGTIDILVGTQMVTKGLDFDRVKMVGVISGDSGLHHPDFRATERTFQMLVQVAGRAGRKGTQGEVCIQTYQPEHYLYQLLLSHNQKEFYATELQQRRIYKYPPFYRLLKITVRHVKIEKVNTAADLLYSFLSRKIDRKMLFGPEFGATPRLKNRYHKVLLIKSGIEPKSLLYTKEALRFALDQTKSNPNGKSVDYILDIDPY